MACFEVIQWESMVAELPVILWKLYKYVVTFIACGCLFTRSHCTSTLSNCRVVLVFIVFFRRFLRSVDFLLTDITSADGNNIELSSPNFHVNHFDYLQNSLTADRNITLSLFNGSNSSTVRTIRIHPGRVQGVGELGGCLRLYGGTFGIKYLPVNN